jgi:hypothetical protein
MAQATEAAGQLPQRRPPMRRAVWRWVWTSARGYVGWLLALGGAIALFVGWFGISGEALTAKQLPYLVSAGLTGIALFILAGVFLATDDVRRQFERISELERKVDDLYSLFVAEIDAPGKSRPRTLASATGWVALPTGTSYHRPDCNLVTGKTNVATVDAAGIESKQLRPCRVCEPDHPAGH